MYSAVCIIYANLTIIIKERVMNLRGIGRHEKSRRGRHYANTVFIYEIL